MKPCHQPYILIAAVSLLTCDLALSQTPATTTAPPSTVPGAVVTPAAVTRNRVILISPDDKRALVMKDTERNPYARRNPDVDLITDDTNQETEADTIRDILNGLPITGRSYGPKGLRVLAGEIIFERGKIVDHVIEDQSENLIVEAVKDNTIELAWIDVETGKLTGKRIVLSYDLTPKVRYVLKGQAKSDDPTAQPKIGYLRSGKPAESDAISQSPSNATPPAPAVKLAAPAPRPAAVAAAPSPEATPPDPGAKIKKPAVISDKLTGDPTLEAALKGQ
jgi:hypothetical protein